MHIGLHRPAADGTCFCLQRAGRAEKATARSQVGTGCSGSAATDREKPVKEVFGIMRELTLLSLFDGSGGFPLAASMCGIRPVACAEVEPYPIAVTRSRFPNMKHLGSVTDVHGGDIEPVDIITFGSPCQDLSVAGKRAGLKHKSNGDEETTRSGLFMEAVRIIKEMREATNGEYPTFAVWENVPGAFSSNKGEDFRTVLEELIKIVEPSAVMPAVPKNGWPYADSYCGDGWSLAYRVFDAQYWGVPQRRRRIYLVLDLRGQRAGKVSFEREGVRGNFATFKTAGQGTAGDAADRTGADDCEGEGNCLTPWDCQSKRVYSADGVFPTLYSGEKSGQNQQSVCVEVMDTPENCKYQADGYCKKIRGDSLPFLPYCVPYTLKIRSGCEGGGKGALIQEDKSATLATNNDQYLFQPCVLEAAGFKAGQSMAGGIGWQEDTSYTLNTIDRPAVAFKTYQKVSGPLMANSHPGSYTGQDAFSDMLVAGVDCRNLTEHPELYPTLQAKPNGGQSLNFSGAVRVQYIVRRLTPTECARLQGFPDDWGHPDHKEDFTDEEYRFWLNVRNTHAAINGKPQKDYTKAQMLTWYNKLHTDSSEYKMWGNGISLPTALYVMQGIAEALKGGEG